MAEIFAEHTDSCILIGSVARTHGLDGKVAVRITYSDFSGFEEIPFVLLPQGAALVPYPIERVVAMHNRTVLKLRFIDNEPSARALIGTPIYVRQDDVEEPEIDENAALCSEEVQGFAVIDQHLGQLGFAEGIESFPMHEVLSLRHPSGKEIMIPFTEEMVLSVDMDTQIIHVCVPDGLVELYLNGGGNEDDDFDEDEDEESEEPQK